MKKEIQLEISESNVNFLLCDLDKRKDENGITRAKREYLYYSIYKHRKEVSIKYFNETYFSAVAYKYANIIVAKALRTILQRAYHPFLWSLYCEVIDFISKDESTRASIECYLSESISDYVNFKPTANGEKKRLKEEEHAKHGRMQYTHIKQYTMKKDENGKRRKIATIPKTILKNTAYGNAYISCTNLLNTEKNVTDLIQTAVTAMTELFRCGLIDKPADVWSYSSFIYKAVNKCIHNESTNKQKNAVSYEQQKEQKQQTEETANSTNSYTMSLKSQGIDKETYKACIIAIAQAHARATERKIKQAELSTLLSTFAYVCYHGLTYEQTAELMQCARVTVKKYRKKLKYMVKTDSVLQSQLYDLLA